jgi:thioredoxin-related protein
MKNILFLILLAITTAVSAQNDHAAPKAKLYNPAADAKADIKAAVQLAAKEGKHVLLQIGGNWCSWCILFDNKVNSNDTLKTALTSNFVTYHLNYSPENENVDVLASLGYPQRFGFPVFVVLDGKGNRLHTQDSAYLEQGRGHSTNKVLQFFNNWSPAAINPKTYAKTGK